MSEAQTRADRHRNPRLPFRPPPDVRRRLERLARKNKTTLQAEVLRAVQAHLLASGL